MRRLLNSLLYFPEREILRTPAVPFSEVAFESEEGERLHGWWVAARRSPVGHVLLWHGNAGNVGDRVPHVELLSTVGFDVLAFDLRRASRHRPQCAPRTRASTVTVMAERRLWAPWRMKYVQAERTDQGCIFCLAAHAGDDEPRHVLHRGERCLVMLNAFPHNGGHLMVSPHRHLASIEDLDPGELLELMTRAQRALRALRDAYQPHGFNLGVNEGEVAGAAPRFLGPHAHRAETAGQR